MRSDEKVIDLRSLRPSSDDVGRLLDLKALALDQAEAELRAGTASPSVLTALLNYDPEAVQLHKQKTEAEINKLHKQAEAFETAARVEDLINNAMEAYRSYQPSSE